MDVLCSISLPEILRLTMSHVESEGDEAVASEYCCCLDCPCNSKKILL